MKKGKGILFTFLLFCKVLFAQNPICADNYVYMDGGAFIKYYDPSLPLSATNPSNTNIPTLGAGLALMPNLNGGTLSPTFYSVSNGTYWYWSGTAWVNTTHAVGNNAAVNLAGCNGRLYNLVGNTGQVYVYNGTGASSLHTTIAGFNGGGPYDLVTDCNCNFYALNTTAPNQGLSMYNASGLLQCTYTLSGMPSSGAGGGFAILGNMIYVKNNTTVGFYIGTISGAGVSFTAVPGFTAMPTDFASCSVCYPSINLAGASISGAILGCTLPTVNLIVTTGVSPVTYSWTGPGIVGPATNSFVSVNTPGTYSCLLTSGTCPPSQATLTTTVLSNSIPVMASLAPSGTLCVGNAANAHLVVTHSATTDVVSWNGPGISGLTGVDSVDVNLMGTYTVNVKDIFSGCVGTGTVTLVQTPTVSLALSDPTLCLRNFNGSPTSITLTPSGASNYTLLTSSNFSTSAPNGLSMPGFPVTITGNLSPYATATLIGSSGGCADTTTASFTIIPNPAIALSESTASICPAGSKALSVNGANTYTWGGSTGLNTYVGSNVIATPVSSSVYSVTGTSMGCRSITHTVSLAVLPSPVVSISPAGSTVCLGTQVTLTASGTADTFSWTPGTGFLSATNSSVVMVSPPNTLVYNVLVSLNSCTSTANATVTVVQPPSLSLNLNSPTLCAQNFNNSPSVITLTPSGAQNYTLLAGNSLFVNSPNGPVMNVSPSAQTFFGPTVLTVTLAGQAGVCTAVVTKTLMVIPNPVLSITPASASICPGQFNSFAVSGASNYTWLPAPGFTFTGANSIVANPTITSFYSVYGTANGCYSDVKNALLMVMPIPEVSVAPKSSTVCEGNSVTLQAIGNAAFYTWSPAGSLSSGFGSQVQASPAGLQTYTVVASLNSCTNQAVSTVSVIEIPELRISASQSVICSDASTNLKVSGAASFFWFPTASLNFASGSAVVANPHENTTYTVYGYNGICTGSAAIHIITIKRPDLELTADVNQVCSGATATIMVSGAQNYKWLPAEAIRGSASAATVIASPLTTTNYTIVGINSIGSVSCSYQISYMVMVVPVIQPVVSKEITLCEGDRTTLYAQGGNSFKWAPAYGLNTTVGAGVVANPLVSTVYTVEVSNNTYCGKTTTVMVNVKPKPSVFAGRDTSYNLNEAIFIEAKGTGTLSWVSGEDIICPACPLTQVYPTRNGCYKVEAVNDYDCRVTDDVCIEVTEDFTAYIPNTFTPNKDGLNDVFLIYGENISQVSMEIYDRWGHKLFLSEDFSRGWDGTFQETLCPPGVYTYVIRYTGLNRKKYTKTGMVTLLK